VEALAVGTPVVATNCEAGPDEILDHGRLGCLVPVGNCDALAAGMSEALRAPRGLATPDDLEPYTEASSLRHFINLFKDLGVEMRAP